MRKQVNRNKIPTSFVSCNERSMRCDQVLGGRVVGDALHRVITGRLSQRRGCLAWGFKSEMSGS